MTWLIERCVLRCVFLKWSFVFAYFFWHKWKWIFWMKIKRVRFGRLMGFFFVRDGNLDRVRCWRERRRIFNDRQGRGRSWNIIIFRWLWEKIPVDLVARRARSSVVFSWKIGRDGRWDVVTFWRPGRAHVGLMSRNVVWNAFSWMSWDMSSIPSTANLEHGSRVLHKISKT